IGSPPFKISPGFKIRDLENVPVTLQPLISNQGHQSFALGKLPIGDKSFFVALYFYQGTVESIDLAIDSEEFGSSWDDWTEEKEMKRKETQDAWLVANTGSTSHVYDWGAVGSSYDPRSGGSSITIRYSWMGRPWRPE